MDSPRAVARAARALDPPLVALIHVGAHCLRQRQAAALSPALAVGMELAGCGLVNQITEGKREKLAVGIIHL